MVVLCGKFLAMNNKLAAIIAIALLLSAQAPGLASIAITAKQGPSTLNGSGAYVGDRLNRAGDTLATRDKSWAGMALTSIKGAANLHRNSTLVVKSAGKQYQIRVPKGNLEIKVPGLKGGLQVTKQAAKDPAIPPIEAIAIGEQSATPHGLEEAIFGLTSIPSGSGGSACLAVEKGAALLTIPTGARAVIRPGFSACAYSDRIGPEFKTDKSFDLEIIPPPPLEPGEPPRVKGSCFLKVHPTNGVEVERKTQDEDGNKREYLPMPPSGDGLFPFVIDGSSTIRVFNPFGEFREFRVKPCG